MNHSPAGSVCRPTPSLLLVLLLQSYCISVACCAQEKESAATQPRSPAKGPLKVHQRNPRMDLAAAVPHNELASTSYCLANPGKEYLIYLPKGGEVTVDLSAANGMFAAEWCHPVTGAVTFGEPVEGKARRSFTSPLPHEGVLYLHPLKP